MGFNPFQNRDSVFDGAEMKLERIKIFDINGLVGKSHRSPVTGEVYLKEIESWRDFTLLDLWKRDKIMGTPEDHCNDPHLYLVRTLNMRTWIYHSKFRSALAKYQIGTGGESFLWEAIAERCVDVNINTGLWSPTMVYAPLVPFTLLADDNTVFFFALFCLFQSMIISVFSNNHTFYFYSRPIMLPARFVFLVLTLTRITGGSIQLIGYLGTLGAILYDLIKGDLAQAGSMGYHCNYEVLRTLPNQVFVCQRIGNQTTKTNEGPARRPLPENLTGIKDNGGGSLCLIANVQGLLMELIPVDEQDAESFKEEHLRRGADRTIGPMRYLGLDILSKEVRSIADMDGMKDKNDPMKQLQGLLKSSNRSGTPKPGDLKLEDMP